MIVRLVVRQSRSNTSRCEDELERLIDEYAADALAQLGAKSRSFTHADRPWLLEHAPSTLGEIETATLRLVAIREFGGITRAAPHLGISHSTLSRWLARRIAPRPGKPKIRECDAATSKKPLVATCTALRISCDLFDDFRPEVRSRRW